MNNQTKAKSQKHYGRLYLGGESVFLNRIKSRKTQTKTLIKKPDNNVKKTPIGKTTGFELFAFIVRIFSPTKNNTMIIPNRTAIAYR
jgi:hypothetical protein